MNTVSRGGAILVLSCTLLLSGCSERQAWADGVATAHLGMMSKEEQPRGQDLRIEFRPPIVWKVPVNGFSRFAGCVVVGSGEGFWAFVAGSVAGGMTIVGVHYDGETLGEAEQVIPPSDTSFYHMAAELDANGQPVVIWGTVAELRYVRRTRGKWSEPETITGFVSRIGSGGLSSIRDAEGRIHLVYHDDIPGEGMYNLGGHGVNACKCYHTMFDGKRWTELRTTTAKGRFHITGPVLFSDPDGTINLAAEVEEYGWVDRKGTYVGYQTWDGEKWSEFRKASPQAWNVSGGVMATDARGVKHVCWTVMRDAEPTAGGGGPDDFPCFSGRLEKGKLVGVEEIPQAFLMPLRMQADSEGRLFLWGSDYSHIRVWDGAKWTGPILVTPPVEGGSKLGIASLPNGHMLLSWLAGGPWRLAFQEVLVGKHADTPSEDQSLR